MSEHTSYTVERLQAYRDARGCVFEPLLHATLASQQNVHIVISEPGAIRGNHYHRMGTETLTVLGPALVRLREHDRLEDITVPAGELYRFCIPPGIGHAVKNTGDSPIILVAFNTEAYVPELPDAVSDPLLS